MGCAVCKAQLARGYLSCHPCPDMLPQEDGTLATMPGCMGGAVDGVCTCEVEPLHDCTHCRHPRPALVPIG